MTPKQERLRKAYEFKIGKDRTSKLSDQQISLLSKYYNGLSEREQQTIDSALFQGRTCEITEMADAFISETTGNVGGGVSIYKPGDKFEDNMKEFAKGQEEKLEEKLEETSDAIMDAIDELLAADRKKFEDFKKQEAKRLADSKKEREQKERETKREKKKSNNQYSAPIGPMQMQGPKEAPKKKSGIIGTRNVLNSREIEDKYGLGRQAPVPAWKNAIKNAVSDDWEGETNDLLEGKLDNLINAIKNEPSVEPKKNKKSKKSKKPLARKMLGENVKEMGLTKSINIMLENIIECRQALFDLYKIEKQRFEFRKKVDKRLTGDLEARVREEEIEEGNNKKKENEFIINVKKKLKRGLLEMLAAGAVALLLPAFASLKEWTDSFNGNNEKKDPVIDDTVVPSGSEFGPNANKEEKPTPTPNTTTPLNPNSRYNPDGSRKDGKEAKDGTLPITADESPLGTFTYNSGGLIPGPRLNKDIIPAMLTPGEFVMSKGAVDKFGLGTMLSMNVSGGGTNRPSYTGMVPGYQGGGPAGMSEGPNINTADYSSLLAISALEDDKPQGRADVAQGLYNRLYAANNYGRNYMQKTNTLKGIINAPDQFQPTFDNPRDWSNITDKNTAAIAVMNSSKGRKYGWSYQDSMNQINNTERALNNPELQSKSGQHVGARAYFLGTSEQGNMKAGDVLRDPSYNFHSHWYDEGSKYQMERGNIPAPVPAMLRPKVAPKTTSAPGPRPGNEVPGMMGPPTPKPNFNRPLAPKPLPRKSVLDRIYGKFFDMLPMMSKPRPQNQSSSINNDLGSRPIGIAAPQQPFS